MSEQDTTEKTPIDMSLLRFFSFGFAAENKKIEGTEDDPKAHGLQVTPTETLTSIDGEVNAEKTTLETDGMSGEDSGYTEKIEAGVALPAMWIDLSGGQRITAPDVRRGERLLILKYGDADKYYWTTLGWDNHLRRLETVIYSISGVTGEKEDATNPDNCYFLEMSSHRKHITIANSNKNGEKAKFTCQLNLADGSVVIQDDKGNEFELHSVENYIFLKNALGSFIKIDKKEIEISAVDSIDANAAQSIKATTKEFTVDAPESIFTGNVTTQGDATFEKNIAVKGTATIASLNVTGTSKMTGGIDCQHIKCTGIDSSGNVNAPNI